MAPFTLNGLTWRIKIVPPNSQFLLDRTGLIRVATTDPAANRIYLSSSLKGNFKMRVLIHELSHAVMVSYGLLDELHQFVEPEHWIEAEEWVCNFLADYGRKVFSVAYKELGDDAWRIIPREMEKII